MDAAKEVLGFARSTPEECGVPWLCHTAGGEIEQIQFLLGYASVLTTDDTSVANRTLSSQ